MTTTPALPLVLLPGLLCDERLWATQAADLAAICPVLIPDLTRDASIAAMARRVLAEAPPRFALGALSMGGYVAFEILRQAPERVARLALFDTMASPDGEARAAQRRAMLELAERGRFLGISPQLLPRLIHASRLDSPVADTVVAMGKAVGKEAFLRQQRAIIDRPDSRPTLATIQVPTLVVVGAQDQLTPPAEAELMHQGIQGSRLVVLDECGHLPPLELPERTTTLLREWLA
ncbi:alpha/beta fold hydrolase [Pseudomonas sp. EpS/L25]|uniref:alpha/beta fold hydrolase n=1 Tax=Pseudomonas sp. EpS/L25 TaxID=1749078 RepID=UPI00074335F9|nr:alpha/beta fold hydrolase [Pseudomonas sp. EpS/L25]KUM42461.1 alpha/beta hydrolase [Pseudomonas sp. EpS/L25]